MFEVIVFLKEFAFGACLGACVGLLWAMNRNVCERLDQIQQTMEWMNIKLMAIKNKMKIEQIDEIKACNEIKNTEKNKTPKQHFTTPKNIQGYDIDIIGGKEKKTQDRWKNYRDL